MAESRISIAGSFFRRKASISINKGDTKRPWRVTVGIESLSRVFILAIILSIVMALPLLWFGGRESSLGFAWGSLWCIANLWIWKILIEEFFGSQRPFLLALLLVIKIPLLYFIGGWVLINTSCSLLWGILGFHFPFFLLGYAIIQQSHQES